MTKNLFFLSLLLLACPGFSQTNWQYTDPVKQRVVVLTDIMNEPDDQQSLVRYLVYANEFDTEGLVATTSTHLRDKVRQDKIEELLSAYGKVRNNLEKHAQGFPSEIELRAVTTSHLPLYGMQGVGAGKDSGGSELLIRAADKKDERPLWVSVWGGVNCLAQALWKVRETRTPEQVKAFVSRLRVYTISDQDDAGRWIRLNFPDIFYVVSPSTERWEEYYRATWTGISGDRHYKNGPMYKFELVDNPWLEQHVIKNHGPLGELYPRLEYIMEGDTPSFIGLINNGLSSALSPAYGGWGGRYDFFQSYAEVAKIWTNTLHSVDEVELPDGRKVASDQATIWRWREAYQQGVFHVFVLDLSKLPLRAGIEGCPLKKRKCEIHPTSTTSPPAWTGAWPVPSRKPTTTRWWCSTETRARQWPLPPPRPAKRCGSAPKAPLTPTVTP